MHAYINTTAHRSDTLNYHMGKCGLLLPCCTTLSQQHQPGQHLFQEKRSCPGWDSTHDTLLSRQSALPTELPGQLSGQGSKSTHTTQSQPQYSVLWHKNPHLICRSMYCMYVEARTHTQREWCSDLNGVMTGR